MPPPIRSINQRAIRNAALASLALMAAAGGTGYGLVKLAQSAHVVPLEASTALTRHKALPPAAPTNFAAKPNAANKPATVLALGATPAPVATAPATPTVPQLPMSKPALAQAVPAPAAKPAAPMAVAVAKPVPEAPAPVVIVATKRPVAAPPVAVAAATPPAVPQQQAAPKPSPTQLVMAAPSAAPAQRVEAKLPQEELVLLSNAYLHAPIPKILVAHSVREEPLRALALPVSLGQPEPPEDDAPVHPRDWHSHVVPAVVRQNGFMPGPSRVETDSSAALTQAPAEVQTAVVAVPENQTTPIAESDIEIATAVAQATNQVPDVVPAMDPTLAPVFVQPPVTQVTVNARDAALPENAPAARIDPAAAQKADQAPDAPYRLAHVPAAHSDKLAVPEYPAVQASVDQAGRVDVGCTITQHGVPDGCHVDRELGSPQFANSVLAWLRSGAVRYRPHVNHGKPAAESRNYRVRFEP